jgi:hypothetical protein
MIRSWFMVTYDTKIGIVVRQDLASWQKLNIACFLTGGLAKAFPEIIGEPYVDANQVEYLSLLRQPVLIFGAEKDELLNVTERARARSVHVAIYAEDLFTTYNDFDNRAAVASVPTADLKLVGVGLYTDRRLVDKILKGLKLLS